jgi:hypothetical protein
MYFIGMPATYATTSRIGSNVAAVPRSGCRRMSRNGTAVSAAAMNRSLLVRAGRRSSPSILASISASTAFANSDGCRLNMPRSIHRRDPPRTAPMNSTASSSSIIAR